MVEVFQTNVRHPGHARMLVEMIQGAFDGYVANFDLEDCDHILRVQSACGMIDVSRLIRLVKDQGFHAEVLSDDKPANEVLQL